MRCLAGGLEVGIGAGDQRHRGDVARIWLVAVASINSSVWVEGTGNAAVVVHDDVWILPLPAQLDRRTVIVRESAGKSGPVIHVETDLFAVGVGPDASPHASAEMHIEDFAAG